MTISNLLFKLKFIFKFSLFYLSIGLVSFSSLLSFLPLSLLGKGVWINRIVALTFRAFVPTLFGIKGKILDGEQYLKMDRPVVYVANHQSTLDMLFLSIAMPLNTVVLVKKQLRWVPLMGQVMMAGKNIFIDRHNRQSAIESMKSAAQQMKKNNVSVWIFPEGTRSHQKNDTMLPFKKGAFHLAKQGGFPIVPVVCSTFAPHLYSEKEMKFNSGTFYIRVLPPLAVSDDDSVEELMKKTQNVMENALKTIEKSHVDSNHSNSILHDNALKEE